MAGLRSRAFRDALVVGVLGLAALALALRAGILETASAWLQAHEAFELDEIVLSLTALSVAFAWFSYRRWRDATREARERQQADAELRLSEGRYRALVRTTASVFWRAGPDGQVLDSGGWEDLTGQFPAASRGEGWLGAIHPEDRERAKANWRAIFASGDPGEAEYRVRRGDGEYRWMLARAAPVRNGDGTIREWVGTMSDIHERKTAQSVLWEIGQRLSAALRAGRMMAWHWDLASGQVTRSDTSLEILGLSSGSIDEFLDRVHEDDRAAYQAAFDAARAGGTYEVEYRFTKPGGGEVWLRETGEIERDAAGRPVRARGLVFDISRSKAAERAIRESEERMRLATEATGLGTYSVDLVTAARQWSREMRAMLGLSAEAPIGRDVMVSLIHPEDRAWAEAAYERKIAAAGALVQVVYRIVRADTGAVRWVSVLSRTLADEAGRPARLVGTLLDVTAAKEAELALRDSEARLRLLTENATDIIMRVLLHGPVLYVSPASREVLGYEPEELTGAPNLDMVHPDDLPAVAASVQALLDKPESTQTVTYRLRHKAGHWVTIETRRRLVRDEQGNPVEFVGVMRDITEQKRIEEQLRLRERSLASIGQGVIIIEARPERPIIYANSAFERLTGYSADEVIGRDPHFLQGPETDVDLVTALDAAVDEGREFQGVLRSYRKDGTPFVGEITSSPVRDRSGAVTHFVVTHFDITDRVRIERELRLLNETLEERVAREVENRMQAEDQLRQSQKMEAVGQLTGGIAHDFNNLLTIVGSSVDLLRRDLPPERRARYLETIATTVDRAAKVTSQLLSFARRQSLRPEAFEAAERAGLVADMLRPVFGARMEIRVEAPDEPCFVRADLSQFETALVNLITNARDALGGEGEVTVRLEPAAGRPPAYAALDASDFLAVSVTDRGAGIAPEHLGRVFEPFFTTKEVGKGTGLGLSQVYGFAKQTGGDVEVESRLGEGTTFTVYLPLCEPPADLIGDGEADEPVGGRGLRVLVVEDNRDLGAFSSQMLADLGYKTDWAADGEEALRILVDRDGGFDVVFSDVVMPGMDGVQLGDEIRRRYPGLPVVLTSGYSHVLVEGRPEGFELLQKPYATETLSRILRKVTQGRSRA